ncbi:MAG: RagB/SusD family nutrient uptake outer membrane protein [Prevotella sp.]|nr:RagB/SusD family nutrient uptake outer membrane protein [Prevotella sp.]
MNYNPIKNLKRGGMLVVSSALFSLCLLSSCEDYTEIIPKGRNMLTKTTDLEYLLNHTYQPGSTDMIEIANNYIYSSTNVALELESDVKTRKQIRWSYDEASMDKLAELTASDEDYDECYEIIGTVANPILMQLPTASGPEEKKNQLKCEALTLRAYFHYLAVQKFAAAYNPATAAETRAIAYLKEDADILKETEQVTLKEVYDNILADLDEAISLDALPQTAPMMRMNKACPYAVKALVCMAMQDNDKAEEAAKQALAINGTVNNYFESLVPFVSKSETVYQLLSLSRYGIDEDYFYTWGVIYAANIPPSNWDFFEKGHIWLRS